MSETEIPSQAAGESTSARAISITAAAVVAILLAVVAWQTAGAVASPMDWLAHGGPSRLMALSVAAFIPAFILGAWWITKPGSRAVLMIMAVAGALPIVAIFNGSVYRTIVVKSAGFVQRRLSPVAGAIEDQRRKTGAYPADISGMLSGVDGIGMALYFPGDGYFILATPGFANGGDGGIIFRDSKTGEWRRYHKDREKSPAAKTYAESIRGIAPHEYIRGPGGRWTETPPGAAPAR
jgi:hypothetical protein